MNKKMKQKLLLAVLAVVALGAGGFYWFAARDTGGTGERAMKTGPVERRERVDTGEDQSKRRARRQARREAKVTTGVERRERTATDQKRTQRRRAGRSKQRQVKKKKDAPAA